MDVGAFLRTQPWLAEASPTDALSPLVPEQTPLAAGLHVGEHTFCGFAPRWGDMTQFTCQLYLCATEATTSLYMRLQDTLYWVDHQRVRQLRLPVNEGEIDDNDDLPLPPAKRPRPNRIPPPTESAIPFLLLDFGTVRLRVWVAQAEGEATMERCEQVKWLTGAARAMQKCLGPHSTHPWPAAPLRSLAPPQLLEALARVAEAKQLSPTELSQRQLEMVSVAEACGVNMAGTEELQPVVLGNVMAALLTTVDMTWALEDLHELYMLSKPCLGHDDCLMLSPDVCSTALWHHWEHSLERPSDASRGPDDDTAASAALAADLAYECVRVRARKGPVV
ncbi:hypothetical protein ACHHYP_12994 [Achlya hypogyna]|uniref:Uncharacterized protein n=1 Tax=Achlya hypogyna TaxID=1202772 RepID=A0A1V9YGA9_ACHHY|nr:hypothetical protein ACHHYP_12994 [Achlya hypogyna]